MLTTSSSLRTKILQALENELTSAFKRVSHHSNDVRKQAKDSGHHPDPALHTQAPIRSPDKPSNLTRALFGPVYLWFPCLALKSSGSEIPFPKGKIDVSAVYGRTFSNKGYTVRPRP